MSSSGRQRGRPRARSLFVAGLPQSQSAAVWVRRIGSATASWSVMGSRRVGCFLGNKGGMFFGGFLVVFFLRSRTVNG